MAALSSTSSATSDGASPEISTSPSASFKTTPKKLLHRRDAETQRRGEEYLTRRHEDTKRRADYKRVFVASCLRGFTILFFSASLRPCGESCVHFFFQKVPEQDRLRDVVALVAMFPVDPDVFDAEVTVVADFPHALQHAGVV